ncbi:MAG TPA: hypothetical protein VM260_05115 [Pirellula sp.]|nr:hypothetical protein [Pirellula sp.]
MPKRKAAVSWQKKLEVVVEQWDEVISVIYDDSKSVGKDTRVSISLYPGITYQSTVKKFLDMIAAANNAKFTGDGTAAVGNDTYVRVTPNGERTRVYFSMLEPRIAEIHGLDTLGTVFNDVESIRQSLNTEYETDLGRYKCRVLIGISPVTLIAYRDIGFDKYFHPQVGDELFIVVEETSGLCSDDITTIVDAFLFELNSSHSLVLTRNSYPDSTDYWGWFENAEKIATELGVNQVLRLKPLIGVSGTGQLLSLYTRATTAEDIEFAFLNYVKVIEFVSVTVERLSLHNELRNQLLDERVQSPDADYISEIVDTISNLKNKYSKDFERLTTAVVECCDLKLFVDLFPKYLKQARKELRSGDVEQVTNGTRSVAQSLISTRNELSHAKPNYSATGSECPAAEFPSLTALAKRIAESCIRWYLGLDPKKRVSRGSRKKTF